MRSPSELLASGGRLGVAGRLARPRTPRGHSGPRFPHGEAEGVGLECRQRRRSCSAPSISHPPDHLAVGKS